MAAPRVSVRPVTGAFGVLGRLVARHLVTADGVRRLVLRTGAVAELEAVLTALGAEAITAAG